MWTPTGTPAYKAPEILKSEPYNENIDSWSIGIIFYELLSGKRPYYNERYVNTIQIISNLVKYIVLKLFFD